MLTLILSGIYANLEAFESVVARARRRRIDRWICLGDVVGYGTDPKACIEMTSSLAETTLFGNHDAVVAGLQNVTYFNSHARQAVAWTKRHVSARDFEYLTRASRVRVGGSALHAL